MKRKKIAIYSSILPDDISDHLELIKQLLLEQYHVEIEDFVIITKDLIGFRPQHQAVFYDFYLTFYDCEVVFLYAQDMIEKYSIIKSNNIYLYLLKNDNKNIPHQINYNKLIGDNHE